MKPSQSQSRTLLARHAPPNILSGCAEMPLPSFVIVPGALHTPDAYSLLIEQLQVHGYKVLAVALPSIGHDPSTFPKSGTADIVAVRAVIGECIAQGEDVVLLMHSLGGILGSEACKGLAKSETGNEAGVVRLFFISGAFTPEAVHVGQSMQGKVGGFETYVLFDAASGTMSADLEQATEYWWNDVSEQRVEEQKRLLGGVRMSAGITDFTTECAAWKWIPSTYLLTEGDRSLLPETQEWFTKQEGAEQMEVVRCEGGHCPWLSRTEEVVSAIRRAAGEEVDM